MRVAFDLSEKDLEHFAEVLAQAREKAKHIEEGEIRRGAAELLEKLEDSEISDFVRERLLVLKQMLDILDDREWKLGDEDRRRVVDAIAYFADPEDMIPDRIPGLGLLDDAILIELVARELRHDLEAYQDFCSFRENEEQRHGADEDPATREEWLKARRGQLHSRMRRRRSSRRSARSRRPAPFKLW